MSAPTNWRKHLLLWVVAPGSLVSVLTAANGFTRCACVYVPGPAYINVRESLVKYLVWAIKKCIE